MIKDLTLIVGFFIIHLFLLKYGCMFAVLNFIHKMKKEKLITIRNYAKSKGITTQYVYTLVKSGKVKYQEIDGVKFIVVEDSDFNI